MTSKQYKDVVTKINVNCIGTSHNGDILVVYENNIYKLYSSNTLLLITFIPNTGTIKNPSNAFIDPHNQYLLVNSIKKGDWTYPWECFKISTFSRLWYKVGAWTLETPIWYSDNKEHPTSSMCVQNKDFYGINLEDGIDLETGKLGTLSYKWGCKSRTTISTSSGAGKPTTHLASIGIYLNNKYSSIVGTYNKDTNEVDFECEQLGSGTIPLVNTRLKNNFLPIKFIQHVTQSSNIIIVQKNNVLHKLTLK